MKQEEINERNVWIATFIGWKKGYADQWCEPAYLEDYGKEEYRSGSRYDTEKLPFHRDWNKLMIAAKIIKLDLVPSDIEHAFMLISQICNGKLKINEFLP